MVSRLSLIVIHKILRQMPYLCPLKAGSQLAHVPPLLEELGRLDGRGVFRQAPGEVAVIPTHHLIVCPLLVQPEKRAIEYIERSETFRAPSVHFQQSF